MKLKNIILTTLCVTMCISCDNWLDVTSDSTTVASEQFSSEAGFRDALIGIYIKLTKYELYGQNLTWRCMDVLAQQYAVVASHPDAKLWSYSYAENSLINYGNDIWAAQYNVIANINNILKWADKNPHVMIPLQDSIIRGELLALRAYCHFDLLRCYGKGNYANRPELAKELTIPYVKDFSRLVPEQVTYEKFFQLLQQDCEQAIAYLKADPQYAQYNRPDDYYDAVYQKGFISVYETDRRHRMNYFAAQGLYARILMWEGSAASKAKAKTAALEAIGENFGEEATWWWWVSRGELSNDNYLLRNGSFINEHLWTLYFDFFKAQTKDYSGNWFRADSPNSTYSVIFLTKERVNEIFELSSGLTSDWRYTKGLLAEGSALSNFAIVKYREVDPSSKEEKTDKYRNRMPMIRVTEMFYIVAECLIDEGKYQEAMQYLNAVRQHRNIPASMDLDYTQMNVQEMREEIKKEYMKEFISEGQLFYYYKRTGAQTISGYSGTMTDAQYVFPLPDLELINGGRTQTELD